MEHQSLLPAVADMNDLAMILPGSKQTINTLSRAKAPRPCAKFLHRPQVMRNMPCPRFIFKQPRCCSSGAVVPTGQCCPDQVECSSGVCATDASECDTEVYCCGCNDASQCNDFRDAAAADNSCWDNDEVKRPLTCGFWFPWLAFPTNYLYQRENQAVIWLTHHWDLAGPMV